MANALQQQMADDIASLVRKQTFAGSGVWRQSGNATLRIETQTDSLVNALQRLPSREEQEEEEREDDRQHAEVIDALTTEPTGSGETTKKKGILGSLFAGLGKLGKSLGSIGKGALGFGKLGLKGITKSLGFLFTALKIIAGPLILLGGLLFLTMDEKEREATIKTIVNALNSAFNFVSMLGNAFKGGFLEGYNEEGGLKDSIKEFSEAWGLVFDSISETVFIPDAGKGLTGVFNWLGKQVASFAKGIVDIGTTLANLITNPEETIGKFRGKFFGALANMGNTIAQFFDDFFSLENLANIFQSMFGIELPEKLRKSLAEGEKERIEERIKQLDKDINVQKSILAQLDEAEKQGEKIDVAKREEAKIQLQFFQKSKEEYEQTSEEQDIKIARVQAEAEIEAELNKDATVLKKSRDEKKAKLKGIEALGRGGIGENFLGSNLDTFARAETAAGEEMNLQDTIDFIARVKEAGGGDFIGSRKNLFGRERFDVFANEQVEAMVEIAGLNFEQFKKLVKKVDELKVERDTLKKDIKNIDDSIDIKNFEELVEKRTQKILDQKIIDEKQSGGRISQTGLYKLHAGEIVFDPPSSDRIDNFVASYLPQSGAMINGLQMDRMMGGMTGTSAPVVIDNSQQPTIINQTNVAAPQTRGPALVGEGRDKVNMR